MPSGLIYTQDAPRGELNREALKPLVPGCVGEIEILTDLGGWASAELPAFVIVVCGAGGGPVAVAREAVAACSQVRARWPRLRPHVGLPEDLPCLALQLLDRGAYDVFLDLTPAQLLGTRSRQPLLLSYNPAERNRLRNSVDRFLLGDASPRGLRLTPEHVPQQEAEWFFIHDDSSPLARERLCTLREVTRHCRGHLDGVRDAETTVFGAGLQNLAILLDRVAVAAYLILSDAEPALFPRRQLVQRLEGLAARLPAHEFDDRSIPVIYITQTEGDCPGIPNKKRFRCGSNVAVASLFWHALQS